MSRLDAISSEFELLLSAACQEDLTPEQLTQLENMARDESSTRLLLDYFQLDGDLRRSIRQEMSAKVCLRMLGIGPSVTPISSLSAPLGESAASQPVFGILSTAYHGTVGFFSQEVPFAILMATLFMAVGGLIGSVMTVEHYVQFPWQSQPSAERSFAAGDAAENAFATEKSNVQWVGRITGMVDCQWSNDKDFLPPGGDYVALGRKYKLDAGLMEITYYTGAKVILQGPVTYEVASTNGGYMSVGKLTGKVEIEKAKGFCVRTPTAVVTDLGTEFGVEVARSGRTESRVFRGKIKVAVWDADGKPTVEQREVVLGEHESATVDLVDGAGSPKLLNVERHAADVASSAYVRNLKQFWEERVIGVNFTHGDRSKLDADERTGVVPSDHWNNIDASVIPAPTVELHDAAGKLRGAKLTWEWAGSMKTIAWQNFDQPLYNWGKLLDGRFNGNPESITDPWPSLTIRISGVPYAHYRVYVYYWMAVSTAPDELHTFGLTLNGGAPTIVGRPRNQLNDFYQYRDMKQSGNYRVFTGLAGDLTIAATPAGPAICHQVFIAGLQIVGEPPSP